MDQCFLRFTQARFLLMLYLAVLSHLRPRFAYILGHYRHARSQGGRQPAAAKPPFYTIQYRIMLRRARVLADWILIIDTMCIRVLPFATSF